MRATELSQGDKATIVLVEAGELKNKLIEMGCFEGNHIQRLYTAPLGDPIAFDINGYILGLRKEEANNIVVNKLD